MSERPHPEDGAGGPDSPAAPLEFGKPCSCPICTFARRRREIEKAPTVEAYAALLADVTDHWINEAFEMEIALHNLRQKVEALEAASAVSAANRPDPSPPHPPSPERTER